MNQEKIGNFIAKMRKAKKLTQYEMAEILGVTDKSVSNWERGLNLPDASIMLDVCDVLGVSVNEMLTGEVIKSENYMKRAEENLIKLQEKEEKNNRLLLAMEWVIGYLSSVSFLVIIFTAVYAVNNFVLRFILIVLSFAIFITGMFFALKIEKDAGYYECGKCHNKYVPKFNSVFFSMHYGRTRYMKCPACGKRSWNKKVLKK